MVKIFNENGDLDQRGKSTTDYTDTFSQDSFQNDKGRADVKGRKNINPRFGDNSLEDESEELEEDNIFINGKPRTPMLIRLHKILNNADVSDVEIKSGIRLTQKGCGKVAAQLGISPDDVSTLISSLSNDMNKEDRKLFDSYYKSMNEDNMILNDTDEDEGYEEQIDSDSGSYNMPWKVNDEHGFATILFTDKNKKPEIEIVSITDDEGNEIEPDEEVKEKILHQAYDYMDKV